VLGVRPLRFPRRSSPRPARPRLATRLKFVDSSPRARRGMPATVLVNINFPTARRTGQGIAVSTQGKRPQELLRIEPRRDGRGNPY